MSGKQRGCVAGRVRGKKEWMGERVARMYVGGREVE